MQPICFIFCFEYSKEQKIPGVLIDAFRIYSIAKNNLEAKTFVITDIKKDKDALELTKGIHKKHCDPSIHSFISNLKEDKEYIFWEDLDRCKVLLEKECRKRNKIFFYYTGHAVYNQFILPNREKVPCGHFTQPIYRACSPNADILFLLDCCNTSYLSMPYLLTMDFSVSRYRSTAFQKGGIFHLHTIEPTFQSQNILCITSAMQDEDSTTTWTGSTFTQLFCNELEEGREKEIHTILKGVQEKMKSEQTCKAYASKPNLLHLFPWLFSPTLQRIDFLPTAIHCSFSS